MTEEDDFGFSLVSEEDLVVDHSKEKLDAILALVLPFLNNLTKDPDKDMIKWPNRVAKVKEFIQKIEKIYDDV